jgi:ubiquinone/menaquinone biosynthesis C-methylase UbiE
MLDQRIRETAADLYWAEGWLALYRSFEAAIITSAIDYRFPERWLDAGCGDGRFAKLLRLVAERFGAPIGIHIDELRLRRARECGVHSHVIGGNLIRLPFPHESFDLIVCNFTLEHHSDPESVLIEFYRVLRRSGEILITIPTEDFERLLSGSQLFSLLGIECMASRYARWMSARIGHLSYWNSSDISGYLWGKGYRTVELKLFGSPYMSAVGDCLHILRMVGIGGSRFSRMEEGAIRANRLLTWIKQIATFLERRIMDSEERRAASSRRWGCLFIRAVKE